MTYEEVLKQSPLFRDMSDGEVESFAAIAEEKSLPQHATIFMENMPGESLFVIGSGTVRVTKMLAEGEEKELAVLHAGDVLGELTLLDPGPRMATARALSETHLLVIRKRDFDGLMKREPQPCIKLICAVAGAFGTKLRGLDDRIKHLLLLSPSA